MSIPLIFLGLLLGAIMSIYVPMIAQTARLLGSGPMANVPFFFIAFATSVVIALATGHRSAEFGRIASLPPWPLTAGIMSAGLIIGTSFLIPRLGLSTLFVLLVSGQVIAAMIFGQLGLFGAPQTTITLGRIAGVAMVIGGVWLTTFK
ncbi:MAG: DMT family transporter [Maritimibacter sp.]|nr:DMT family transporter [Maritimibacter sp.]